MSDFEREQAKWIRELERAGLVDVAKQEFRWSIPLDPEAARALHGTFSSVIALPESERRRVLDEIGDVVASEFNGVAHRTVLTVIYTGRRPLGDRA